MQRAQTRPNARKWTSDPTEFAAEPFELAEAGAEGAARNSALLTAAASLLRLDQGLYAIEIGETTAPDGEISGLMLPVIQISGDRDEPLEIVGTSASGVSWLAQDGGTQKLSIEAFSIRPLEILTARDIEFKAVGPNGRETPWSTEAELCGTRGRSLPLTGFAIRLAPRVSDEFEVVYRGAFFESGIVGPKRNGEICIPSIHDDPLKAIEVHLTRRAS